MENTKKRGRKPLDPKQKKQIVTVCITGAAIDYFGDKQYAAKAMQSWAEAKAKFGHPVNNENPLA
jgi:hypothetical protein